MKKYNFIVVVYNNDIKASGPIHCIGVRSNSVQGGKWQATHLYRRIANDKSTIINMFYGDPDIDYDDDIELAWDICTDDIVASKVKGRWTNY
ncbi:hypothetical protein HMPREF0872_03865 [Veillonella montpellierensis DNF00314]|uniref:Uncharacterized protein n=1 Tax=Veillonella montpellierensis DNF00314 TaxID=1401067 RepID=A0A096CQC8_9FIRM|nr:hypothetical protein [Veillonella montpellierensis]KGF47544.1 hypothetical protein HMPREF0872_03865 [Veillonella montpellierensis DNF00314]